MIEAAEFRIAALGVQMERVEDLAVLVLQILEEAVGGGPSGTRTQDQRIMSPLL